jgi:hypothetical protein
MTADPELACSSGSCTAGATGGGRSSPSPGACWSSWRSMSGSDDRRPDPALAGIAVVGLMFVAYWIVT